MSRSQVDFQIAKAVAREHRDAIAGREPQCQHAAGEFRDAAAKLGIAQYERPLPHGRTVGVKPRRAIENCSQRKHLASPLRR